MVNNPLLPSEGQRRSRPRREHKKTRTGCSDCRRRRIKCTEERPSCRYCVRRQVPCRYPGSSSFSGQTERISTLTDSTCFNLQDIALLHHWVTSTSLDLPNRPEADRLWQIDIPKIGFEYPFVFYAILSVAVLHRMHVEERGGKSDVLAAIHYHTEGLRRFQVEVEQRSAQNSEALFLWSALNAIYVFAASRESHDEARRDHDPAAYDTWRERVLGVEWFPLNRGATSLLHPEGVNIKESRLAQFFNHGNYFDLDPLDFDLGCAGEELMRCQETWLDDPKADTYFKTQATLHRCYAFLSQSKSSDAQLSRAERASAAMRLFVPIYLFPADYLRLLQQRQPPALVLFSFFGALLHRARDYWVFEGWGENIVMVVSELLGSYWRPWIAWPLQAIAQSDA